MITTRPLLPEALTASWIESNVQRLASLLLVSISALPSAAVIFCGACVGRMTYPVVWAVSIACCVRFRESGWHTTLVFGSETADASDRAVGTAPPAHGDNEQSGAGSGQYDARSTCAEASAGTSSALRSAAMLQMHSRNLAVVLIRPTSPMSRVTAALPAAL